MLVHLCGLLWIPWRNFIFKMESQDVHTYLNLPKQKDSSASVFSICIQNISDSVSPSQCSYTVWRLFNEHKGASYKEVRTWVKETSWLSHQQDHRAVHGVFCISHSEAIPELSTPAWQPYPSLPECIDASCSCCGTAISTPWRLSSQSICSEWPPLCSISFWEAKFTLFLQYFVFFSPLLYCGYWQDINTTSRLFVMIFFQ